MYEKRHGKRPVVRYNEKRDLYKRLLQMKKDLYRTCENETNTYENRHGQRCMV